MAGEISMLSSIDQNELCYNPSHDCGNCELLKENIRSLRRELQFLLSKSLVECSPMLNNSCQTDSNILLNNSCQTDIFNDESDTDKDITALRCGDMSALQVEQLSIPDNIAANVTIPGLNVFSYNPDTHEAVEPFTLIPGSPFSHIDLRALDSEIEFTRIGNRHAAYFGLHPYAYGGTVHPACHLIPGSTLLAVTQELKRIIPGIEFNSVLATKFNYGSEYLPYHQDNETMIADQSQIATITFGECRSIKFRALSDSGTEISVCPTNGQVYTMTKLSQSFFQHSVPKTYGKGTRISLTFRLIVPDEIIREQTDEESFTNPVTETVVTMAPVTDPPNFGTTNNPPTPSHDLQKSAVTPPTNKAPSTTLYISSSMFKHLDSNKLSTQFQTAHVFSYPGQRLHQC